MSLFDSFQGNVTDGAKSLAQQTLQYFITQAKSDTSDFLNQSKQQLNEWTDQLALGQLSQDEFADLVGGLKDLAAMQALTEAGIVATRVQRFRDAVIKLVIDTAFKTFLP
jgi:hypothetical protein